MPEEAIATIQSAYGKPPMLGQTQELNDIIFFQVPNQRHKKTPPVCVGKLNVFHSGDRDEALLDLTFASKNGVFNEDMCHKMFLPGTPLYSKDGKELLAIATPSRSKPLSCLIASPKLLIQNDKKVVSTLIFTCIFYVSYMYK